MPPPAHLSGADDLVTKPEATRAGFLALAIERTASPPRSSRKRMR